MLACGNVVHALLRSPVSGQPLVVDGLRLVTPDGNEAYPMLAGKPVLIDFKRSAFTESDIVEQGGASVVDRPKLSGPRVLLKRLVRPIKRPSEDNMAEFARLLVDGRPHPVVLVIGGGTVGEGMAGLYEHPGIRVLALDVYASPMVQLIADAHQLPLDHESIDGVVVQAVLEHVLEPEKVVAEVWRVLKPDGLVYAETPFLQQVHEGPYDFLRFTGSGHRWLFRHFELVRSGVCGGAGTQLLWSIDYFARSLFRSRTAGKAFKLLFFWVALFDVCIPENYASDTASGFYLLGRKTERVLNPREVVAAYAGAQSSR